MNLSTGLTTLAASLALTLPTFAGDFYGLDPSSGTLYDIDATTGTSTVAGTLTGGGPFGYGAFVVGQQGKGYMTIPGFISGYTVYEVDMTTFVATPLHTIATSAKGDAGLALSPRGDKLFVSGFVGLAFRVQLQEIDIATGAMTSHGDIPPGYGLAFDSAGDLYTAWTPIATLELVRIDLSNPANSVTVGSIPGVDVSFGYDLSSDQGSGDIHLYARNSDSIYTIDTTSGAPTLLTGTTGATGMRWLTEIPCEHVQYYGDACVGTGGYFPRLSIGGCPESGASITLDITDGLGGAPGAIFLGAGRTSIPLGNGCDLLITPIFPFTVSANLGAGGPGEGAVSVPVLVPGFMPAGTITLQGILLDNGSVGGYVTTNGAEISFE